MAYLSEEERKRFWPKIDVRGEDECWEWTAAKANGYGRFRSCGILFYAHRVVILDSIGIKDQNNVIRHTCDNPSCCNPKHLIEGSHYENTHDMMDRGRFNYSSGKLEEEDVYEIRLSLREDPSTDNMKRLAKLYEVTSNNIYYIKTNRSWTHIKIKVV